VLQVGTPHEIYESPATDFVARFIGETNLFDAKVAKIDKLDQPLLPSISTLGATEFLAELDIPELGRIKVTTVDEFETGQEVCFTIRPEKIVISKERPATKREDINLFQGAVDEPIYSGFQTKFYVKTPKNLLIRVIKQHANYSDEGPDIVWKVQVYLSWSANDGYIVGVKDAGDSR
jgi:spermidine/putrescine transport system ATP-binding protein